jgi:hypothetical protein
VTTSRAGEAEEPRQMVEKEIPGHRTPAELHGGDQHGANPAVICNMNCTNGPGNREGRPTVRSTARRQAAMYLLRWLGKCPTARSAIPQKMLVSVPYLPYAGASQPQCSSNQQAHDSFGNHGRDFGATDTPRAGDLEFEGRWMSMVPVHWMPATSKAGPASRTWAPWGSPLE